MRWTFPIRNAAELSAIRDFRNALADLLDKIANEGTSDEVDLKYRTLYFVHVALWDRLAAYGDPIDD